LVPGAVNWRSATEAWPAAASSATTDPASSAVLSVYRASSATFAQTLAIANPADPAVAATMIDPLLQFVKANLLADQRQGASGAEQ
jgi:hypothetical protein